MAEAVLPERGLAMTDDEDGEIVDGGYVQVPGFRVVSEGRRERTGAILSSNVDFVVIPPGTAVRRLSPDDFGLSWFRRLLGLIGSHLRRRSSVHAAAQAQRRFPEMLDEIEEARADLRDLALVVTRELTDNGRRTSFDAVLEEFGVDRETLDALPDDD